MDEKKALNNEVFIEKDRKTDIKTLNKRISAQFQPVSQTMYHIEVVNQSLEKQYNFFFVEEPKGRRVKSLAIHSIKNYDLKYLEETINEITTKLTIKYRGFENLKWPSINRLIK